MTREPVRVVIAAGGLGTRVAGWAQLLPKEFQPVDGRPGLLRLLDELADAGADQAVLVYHRYYETFIGWVAAGLRPGGQAHYRAVAGLPAGDPPPREALAVQWVRQHGPYADVTSVLNGADRLPRGPLYVAYADNLYLATNALGLLTSVPGDSAVVLARPFTAAEAGRRGVIITKTCGAGWPVMTGLVEKPDVDMVARLLAVHGPERLRLLEGRFRLPVDLVDQLRGAIRRPHRGEPRLSLAFAAYARTRPVYVVTTGAPVLDLGVSTDPPRLKVTRTGLDGVVRSAREDGAESGARPAAGCLRQPARTLNSPLRPA